MSVETRRSVKSHASDAWKRRLRADVLDRVRAHRAALLTRARGDGSPPGDGLRTLLNDGLREILHDAIDTETRLRLSQDPDDADDGMWDDDIADPRTDRRAASAATGSQNPRTTSGSGRVETVDSRVSAPRSSWNELSALGFTDVEYDALMAEMHRGFEEELREEEAALLALELEKAELRERAETRDACERDALRVSRLRRLRPEKESTSGDEPSAREPSAPLRDGTDDDDENEHVLCPVCRESWLLQTRGSIFCAAACGVRLSRADPTCEGNAGKARGSDAFSLETVRARLAGAFAKHGEDGCKSSLVFSMKDAFGTSALYAECRENKCAFLEVVM